MIGEKKENQKVRNAKKVDIHGNKIKGPLAEWREANPDEIVFDSELERFCYVSLRDSGLSFVFKPQKETIVPASVALDWDYDEEQKKHFRDFQRGVKDKRERAANTRSFNKANKKSLVWVKEQAWTWSPDFLLPDHKMYVDTKGNKKDAHWRNKLKAARHILEHLRGYNIIQLQTKKEITEFINYLHEHKSA